MYVYIYVIINICVCVFVCFNSSLLSFYYCHSSFLLTFFFHSLFYFIIYLFLLIALSLYSCPSLPRLFLSSSPPLLSIVLSDFSAPPLHHSEMAPSVLPSTSSSTTTTNNNTSTHDVSILLCFSSLHLLLTFFSRSPMIPLLIVQVRSLAWKTLETPATATR